MSQSHGLDPGEYCRAIEAHLCRKNDGHLIRIVGPAFDVVCRWATRGVPLTIACQGIDQYFERYYATRARRRPVQVQFCEGDVLALYDDWRRSVAGSAGFRTRDGDVETGSSSPSVHEGAGHGTLPAHLERVIARLTVLRGRGVLDDDLLDRVVREVDAIRSVARTLRGAARDQALERLRDLDRQVLAGAGEAIPATDLRRLRDDAERGLAGYRDRLSPDAYDQAVRVATDRLLRAQVRLPELTY